VVLNSAIFLGILFLITVTILSVNIYRLEHIKTAIIITREENARFEPLEDAVVHFKLYAGSKVFLIRTKGNWSQVKREDGKIGWVESSSYGII
jgi:SH3-like domain-containing protein